MCIRDRSVLGTAAMFTVGGSIIVHGVPALEHLIEGIASPLAQRNAILGTLVTTLLDAIAGIVAGALAVGVVMLGKRLLGRKRSAATTST